MSTTKIAILRPITNEQVYDLVLLFGEKVNALESLAIDEILSHTQVEYQSALSQVQVMLEVFELLGVDTEDETVDWLLRRMKFALLKIEQKGEALEESFTKMKQSGIV